MREIIEALENAQLSIVELSKGHNEDCDCASCEASANLGWVIQKLLGLPDDSRDRFAAACLPAVVSTTDMLAKGSYDLAAHRCYQMADAMIRERGKGDAS